MVIRKPRGFMWQRPNHADVLDTRDTVFVLQHHKHLTDVELRTGVSLFVLEPMLLFINEAVTLFCLCFFLSQISR